MSDYLPLGTSLAAESTGKIFFSTSSMGPGRWAIFSLRSSASLALFSLICVACSEGSACVSGEHTQRIIRRGEHLLALRCFVRLTHCLRLSQASQTPVNL